MCISIFLKMRSILKKLWQNNVEILIQTTYLKKLNNRITTFVTTIFIKINDFKVNLKVGGLDM